MPLFTRKFHEYVALNDIATFKLVCVDKRSQKMLKLNKAYVHTIIRPKHLLLICNAMLLFSDFLFFSGSLPLSIVLNNF